MVDDKTKILQIFEEWIEKDQCQEKEDNKTFLSLIGREHYENYISKLVLYAIINPAEKILLKNLIDEYKKFNPSFRSYEEPLKINDYCTEKYMSGGRADIFVEIEDKNENIITLTLENKIWSSEHETGEGISQTETYSNYIENRYPNGSNVFIYLKPAFNLDTPNSQNFMTMTYGKLKKLMPSTTDYIIKDLKKHIGGYLLKMKFEDVDKFYFENYQAINKLRDSAERNLGNLKEEIIKYLKNDFNKDFNEIEWIPYDKKTEIAQGAIVMEKADKDCSFRIYRKDYWYYYDKMNKDGSYYFYTELLFEDNILSNIICQNVIKKYSDNSIVEKYIKDTEANRIPFKPVARDFYVVDKDVYAPEGEAKILDEEWIDGLKKWASKNLQELFAKWDKEFEKFYNLKDELK